MKTAASDAAMTTAIAAPEQTKADATPRLKLLPHGFSIDHPDPGLGEQLMANALGVIAAQLGHADTRMTEKHYAHLAPSHVAQTIRANFPVLNLSEEPQVIPLRKRVAV
jgi:hypothetical protein